MPRKTKQPDQTDVLDLDVTPAAVQAPTYDDLVAEVAHLRAMLAAPMIEMTAMEAIPTVLYVSGSEVSGTERRLVRCDPPADATDAWLVQIGSLIVLRDGRTIPARPYNHLPPSTQRKARWTYDDGIAAAKSYGG